MSDVLQDVGDAYEAGIRAILDAAMGSPTNDDREDAISVLKRLFVPATREGWPKDRERVSQLEALIAEVLAKAGDDLCECGKSECLTTRMRAALAATPGADE